MSEVENFEDVTQELYGLVDEHLEDNQMICKPGFNLDDTMSCIELNDIKMDLRVQRHKVVPDNAK